MVETRKDDVAETNGFLFVHVELVVLCPLCRVTQNRVGFTQLLEPLLRPLFLIFVGMKFDGQLPKTPLDVLECRCRRNLKNMIIVR